MRAGASPISSGSSPTQTANAQIKLLVRSAEQRQFQQMASQIGEVLTENAQLRKMGAKVEVVVTKEGLRIELIESGTGEVFFPLGSSQMKPAAVLALQLVAPELQAMQNPIVVEGHTDAARYGTSNAYGNWELSAERANAARRLLESAGLGGGRIAEVRGLADRQPRVAENPMDPANRRISILLPYRRGGSAHAGERGGGGAGDGVRDDVERGRGALTPRAA